MKNTTQMAAKPRPTPPTDGRQKMFAAYCKQSGLPEPTAEHKFHPSRNWRIDYYFENVYTGRRIALEVEGGVHTGGRHTRPQGFKNDIEKYNALSIAGIYLIRTTPGELFTIKTIQLLKQALSIIP